MNKYEVVVMAPGAQDIKLVPDGSWGSDATIVQADRFIVEQGSIIFKSTVPGVAGERLKGSPPTLPVDISVAVFPVRYTIVRRIDT